MRTETDLRRELENVAEALDESVVTVTSAEVIRHSGQTYRPTRRRVITVAIPVVAILAVAAVVALVNRGDTEIDGSLASEGTPGSSTPEPPIERRPLLAEASVIGDEIWVSGGRAGPPRSDPSAPGDIPDDWTKNPTVVMYDSDGSLRFHAVLPEVSAGELFESEVVADGDDRYLVTSACLLPECMTGVQPLLYRLENNSAVLVPLDVSDEAGPGDEGQWPIEVVGVAGDGIVWATQPMESPGPVSFEDTRLLAIDLHAATVTEIPFPEAHSSTAGVCVIGSEIFGLFPTETDSGQLAAGVRVLRRPAITEQTSWSVLFERDLAQGSFFEPTIDCHESGEVVLVVRQPADLERSSIRIPLAEGAVPGASGLIPGTGQLTYIGQVGDRSFYTAERPAMYGPLLLALEPDGTWTPLDVLPVGAMPAVIDGELRNVRSAASTINPDGVDVPVINVSE